MHLNIDCFLVGGASVGVSNGSIAFTTFTKLLQILSVILLFHLTNQVGRQPSRPLTFYLVDFVPMTLQYFSENHKQYIIMYLGTYY